MLGVVDAELNEGVVGVWQLITVALGSGVTVKVLDILYQEARRRSEREQSARKAVEQHLDPILRSADELVGKLRSLAQSDFSELRGKVVDSGFDCLKRSECASVIVLFGSFWARVELLRRETASTALTRDSRGKQLHDFFGSLESKRIRLVDRITQRAVAETMIDKRDVSPFIHVVRELETRKDLRRWLVPLIGLVTRANHLSVRQRLLQYGAVVHALIDTLDAGHKVTKPRPGYPNKLTKRVRRNLRYHVFGEYLRFVENPGKYYQQRR